VRGVISAHDLCRAHVELCTGDDEALERDAEFREDISDAIVTFMTRKGVTVAAE